MPDTIYLIGLPPEQYLDWVNEEKQRRLIIISQQIDKESLWHHARWAVAHSYEIIGENEGIASLLRQYILLRRVVHEEYLGMGSFYFRNFYRNLKNLHNYFQTAPLYDSFKGIPAIICGAGPSLQHRLPLLKAYRQQACIFGCGGALGALTFPPHFGVAIDPYHDAATRMHAHDFFELPVIANLRLHFHALEMCHGPTFLVNSSGGYNTAHCLEEILHWPAEERDEGYSSVTFATCLAQSFGCNPIYFVGLDLAFTGGQVYSPGVTPTASQDLLQNIRQDVSWEGLFSTTDIHGKQITSLWKWWAESQWLASFAKEHPETQFINATGEGLGIPGVSNQPLGNHKNKDIEPYIHTQIQASQKLPNSGLFFYSLLKSFEKVDCYLDRVLDSLEIEATGLISFELDLAKMLQASSKTIAESDIDRELSYAFILKDAHDILQTHIDQIHRDLDIEKSNNKCLERINRKARLYVALKEIVSAHLENIESY